MTTDDPRVRERHAVEAQTIDAVLNLIDTIDFTVAPKSTLTVLLRKQRDRALALAADG